ncbi:iron response transcriptional regulator IrrA [Aurantimonas sp. Leaf443]|uniref:iron response transcriptional regulator IrrA n=1 Tax=Aurantimonas sp. Leaf443 TaxID=1736378 RepID=UPI0006F996DD|nr:Fur family transcriptional regulator [Aurantimonas sp. Leaf443]KQT83916.1 Fur family transcriptional regulator [Aurantimonas sp. Leaf443]
MDTRTRTQSFCVFERLRSVGLRPTRQRVALCNLMFGAGDRHLSAETLHEEAHKAGEPVSLATVYNTLHQFTDAGLVRPISAEGQRTYFDTNTSDHHHFLVEDDNAMIDIPDGQLSLGMLPEPPEGMEIVNVDVVVRLRRKRPQA